MLIDISKGWTMHEAYQMPPRPPAIRTKMQFQALQTAGVLGNCLPTFFTVDNWLESRPAPGALWGVQHTKIAGFPHTRLNTPTEEVADQVRFFGPDYKIAPMVPAGSIIWEGDIRYDPALTCFGHYKPEPGSWRKHMRTPDVFQGVAAEGVLALMSPSSREDLRDLFDLYPDHVIETSVMNRNFGMLPNRNSVIWEVRLY